MILKNHETLKIYRSIKLNNIMKAKIVEVNIDYIT